MTLHGAGGTISGTPLLRARTVNACSGEESEMKVKDVMKTEVTTVGPETMLRDVAAILAERGISGLPVVENGGSVIGVVSEADILMKEAAPQARRDGLLGRLLEPPDPDADAKLAARTAREAMTSPAVTVESKESVPRAAALMVERGINRLPVVDGGALVGIVTRADLVRAFTREDSAIASEIRNEVILRQFWVDPETVLVNVKNGEVTLKGELERRSVAELLGSFVERVPGVVAVDSQLSWREDDRP
jgi:CBS domain-containing protein